MTSLKYTKWNEFAINSINKSYFSKSILNVIYYILIFNHYINNFTQILYTIACQPLNNKLMTKSSTILNYIIPIVM